MSFPMSTKGGGMCMGMPDVLKVPAPPPVQFIPTPFPNMGQCAMAARAEMKVMASGMPVLTVASEIPSTLGGEAGTQKGLISPMQLAKATYKLGSMTVKAGGKAVVMLNSMTAHNGANANAPVGSQTVPSQVMVLIGS